LGSRAATPAKMGSGGSTASRAAKPQVVHVGTTSASPAQEALKKAQGRADAAAGFARQVSPASQEGRLIDNLDPKGLTSLVLAADVGGTNSRLLLYSLSPDAKISEKQQAPGTLVFVRKYMNINFGSFSEIMSQFFVDVKSQYSEVEAAFTPVVACLAVAGVVQQNVSRLTNLDWRIDGDELSSKFRIAVVEIINDFVAQGYGVLTLSDSEVQQISGPEALTHGPKACVGAGTGLGQCFLTPGPDGSFTAYPSEGGHAEFAPRGEGSDETQIELLRYLKVKFSAWNRISFERVVSGKGICNVYEFLAYRSPQRVDKAMHKEFQAKPGDASVVVRGAKPDSLCEEALKIFASCYGAVCGTFALQTMPFGGLYLTGGVTQKLRDFLQKDESFMDAFFDKGRVAPMLHDIPLLFVKGDDMGMRGAHLRAVHLLKQQSTGMTRKTHRQASKHLVPPRSQGIVEIKSLLGDTEA